MPKPPPVEYFRVTCEVDAATLGATIAALTKMGVARIATDLVTAEATFKQKNSYAIKTEDFLAEWIAEHPTFRASEAVKHCRADGRTDGAAYTALRMMVENKFLKKLSPGQYSRADVKAIAAPKKKKKAKATKPQRHDISGPDFALRLMSRNHGRVTSATLKKHFESDGRAPAGVGPTLNHLLKRKAIKRLGDGAYELAPKKTNGAAPVIEAAANG
jgi:hypothetical protein